MFDTYIQKVQVLQSYYGLKANDRDTVIVETIEFLINIQSSYIEQWCLVEAGTKVILSMESLIKNLGDAQITL